MHFRDARHLQHEGFARHGTGDIETARADGEHTNAAARRRVRVRAEQCCARAPEALEVDLVADAIAGAREVDAVFFRDSLQILVIVCVFKAALQCVVIDVAHREICFYVLHAHGFHL